MRHLILLFIALPFAAGAGELVVGEQGSVTITLPNQPNNQKCNIEVKFADGSSQDIEVDPKNPSASVSFTPTIAGTQVIQWDGKMKWRGLKSRPPCEGDGTVEVSVRDSDEVLAERLAAQLKEDELFREGGAAFDRGDYQSAVEIWTPLADAGNVVAQFNLGYIFERGVKGIASNTQMAVSWYERAAAQGNQPAKAQLSALKEKVAQQAKIRAEQEAQARIEDEKQQKKNEWISFAKTPDFAVNYKNNQEVKACVLEMGLGYIEGEFQLSSEQRINSWKTFSNYYGLQCDNFLVRLQKKNWWTTFVPPEISDKCWFGEFKSDCIPHYEFQRDGQWVKVTPVQLLVELDALAGNAWHVLDNKWRLRGTETAALKAKRCERIPMSDTSCPNYASAKEKQERREAAAEKKRQLAAAKQPKRFDIPGAYICTNKNSADMAIQLAYSRTSDELASMIRHIPTSRIDMVMTWLYFVPDKRSKNEFNYRNTNIRSTVLTILPKESRVLISGDGSTLEFINCLMMRK